MHARNPALPAKRRGRKPLPRAQKRALDLCRVNEEERASIRERAEDAGMTVADFVIWRTLEREPPEARRRRAG